MDLDAYAIAHGSDWSRLDELSRRRVLTGGEADELVDLYQATASQLSAIKTTVGSSVQGDRLSLSLVRARLHLTGTPANPLASMGRFFTLQLPAALYRVRILTLVIAGATALIAVAVGLWFSSTPGAIDALAAQLGIDPSQYANESFENYYSDNSLVGFTGQVWTNNAWIAAQCIAFGITGVWVPFAIGQNAIELGEAGAVMGHEGKLADFFLYIAPHGQLELYTIFTAGAAGLMIFWSWVSPGRRTRGQALQQDARALFALVIGCAIMLLFSGIVEGFVTRQDWPWPVKIGIGTVALAIFLVYQWVFGRRAALAGATGDIDAQDAGATQLVAV